MKKKLYSMRKYLGAFLSFPSPEVIEFLGLIGWDVVVLDLEHGSITRSELPHMFRAAKSVNISTMVRVSENDPKEILGVLDLGAEGILIPMINTVEDAKRAISSVFYPPDGIRGLSQGRSGNYGVNRSIHKHVEDSKS